jgi:hypothetical protein
VTPADAHCGGHAEAGAAPLGCLAARSVGRESTTVHRRSSPQVNRHTERRRTPADELAPGKWWSRSAFPTGADNAPPASFGPWLSVTMTLSSATRRVPWTPYSTRTTCRCPRSRPQCGRNSRTWGGDISNYARTPVRGKCGPVPEAHSTNRLAMAGDAAQAAIPKTATGCAPADVEVSTSARGLSRKPAQSLGPTVAVAPG